MSIQRARRADERGAIIVIFALTMVAMIGMLAIAIDLSYGFVQNRRAQNASDFAAFATSQALNGTNTCNGTAATPNMAQVVALVQDMATKNAGDVGTGWTATFLDGSGKALTGAGATFSPSSNNLASQFPPFGACGVSVNAAPTWKTFFASVFGVNSLKGGGNAKATNIGNGPPYGIISLNPSGPHAVLGGGSGDFIVNGDIILDTNVSPQPWTLSENSMAYDDAIDAKTGSNLYVYGTIESDYSNSNYLNEYLWPLDWCFGGAGLVGEVSQAGMPADSASDPSYSGAGSPSSNPPTNKPHCSQGTVTVDYNHLWPFATPVSDPVNGSVTDPITSTSSDACPGMATQTLAGGTYTNTTLKPGIYTTAVTVTGNSTFGDCSEYAGEPSYPGVYVFQGGLVINPGSGNTVKSDPAGVTIATENPDASLSDNVASSGTGNGGPCLPVGTAAASDAPSWMGGTEVDNTHQCNGTTDHGVKAWNDGVNGSCGCGSANGNYGTGTNYSLEVGGAGTVNLTGPTYGGWGGAGSPGLVFYQEPTVQANYGFDAEPGDTAAITINGVVYNASLTTPGVWQSWDDGIPFYAGGTLQAGFGAGWSTPTPSGGTVKINGTAIVDDFNTDGGTTIDIQGQPYTLPGGSKLSLVG